MRMPTRSSSSLGGPRRWPSGMAAYAVSPGGATDTKVVRNAGPLLKYLFIPIVNLIPGMNQTPETAARRYHQASEFGTDVSGQFFASAQGKFSGPIEAQRHPHLHDRASQEAAWQAVVKVSAVVILLKTVPSMNGNQSANPVGASRPFTGSKPCQTVMRVALRRASVSARL